MTKPNSIQTENQPIAETAPRTETANRRNFIKGSSALLAGGAMVGATLPIARAAHAYGSDVIKIGLIGSGGRGSGAAEQAMNTTGGDVRLVAMGDVFADRLQQSYRALQGGKNKDKVDVTDDTKFIGLDAYKRVLGYRLRLGNSGDTAWIPSIAFPKPPWKPASRSLRKSQSRTDAPGVRRFLAANEKAKEKRSGRCHRFAAPSRSGLQGNDRSTQERRHRRYRLLPLLLEPRRLMGTQSSRRRVRTVVPNA